MLWPSIFIPPCEPIQRDRPPKGEAWLYEVKFDGYRMQVHKAGRKVTIFTRHGHNWTDRFPGLAAELAALPSCISDAELVATDAHGIADFATLQRIVSKRQEDGLALWAFDLLYVSARDIRSLPYIERKMRLASFGSACQHRALRHSEFFPQPGLGLAERRRRRKAAHVQLVEQVALVGRQAPNAIITLPGSNRSRMMETISLVLRAGN